MFRTMRRNQQLLPEAECLEILNRHTSGVLAVSGDDGYPYSVPLSHVYQDGKLFFHGAREGHKLDAITRNDKVSFCVIDQDQVMPQAFATYFRSVVVFGRARLLTEADDRQPAMEAILQKFAPEYFQEGLAGIQRAWEKLGIIEVTIEQMTGKESIELVEARSAGA